MSGVLMNGGHCRRAIVLSGLLLIGIARPASAAETVSRESDIGELRLGQRVQVDDGMCPAGQIKEVSGAQLKAAGVARVVKCVPRPGSRR